MGKGEYHDGPTLTAKDRADIVRLHTVKKLNAYTIRNYYGHVALSVIYDVLNEHEQAVNKAAEDKETT